MAHLSFFWNNSALIDSLAQCRYEQGLLVAQPSNFVHSLELDESGAELYGRIMETAHRPLTAADLPLLAPDTRYDSAELADFLSWWNDPPSALDPILRAGVAFFWYLNMIDLNSRSAGYKRAGLLPELSLQSFEKTQRRHYDLFQGLASHKEVVLKNFSLIKNKPADSPLDLTAWLLLFINIFSQCLAEAGAIAEPAGQQDLFWLRHRHTPLNSRQKKALEYALSSGHELTNRLYVSLTKVSRETAKRDLDQLVRQSVIERSSRKGGRSVSYIVLE